MEELFDLKYLLTGPKVYILCQ